MLASLLALQAPVLLVSSSPAQATGVIPPGAVLFLESNEAYNADTTGVPVPNTGTSGWISTAASLTGPVGNTAIGYSYATAWGDYLASGGSHPAPEDPSGYDKYAIVFSSVTWDGYDAPTRNGRSDPNGFGFYHACYDHNLCSAHIFGAAYDEHVESVSGTKRTYGAVLTDQYNEVYERFVVVMDASEQSEDGPTPDGRPVGTITAFCKTPQGVTENRCPDYVNDY